MKARHALLAFGVTTILACQIVAGIERVEKTDLTSPGGDGGPGGRTDSSIPSNDPCGHALPNPKPPDESPDIKLDPIYLAIKTLNPIAKAGSAFGLDLDDTCSCDDRKDTARAGARTCNPRANAAKDAGCDDNDGGIDNHGAVLLGTFPGLGLQESAEKDINEGERTILIYVADWNGKPNDVLVRIGIALASTSNVPSWGGQDIWNFDPAGMDVNQKIPRGTGFGYVSNGQLVYRSEQIVPMIFGKATLEFGQPITIGTLVNVDGHWELKDAILTGRLKSTELVAAFGALKGFGGGETRVCQDELQLGLIKDAVCGGSDIMSASAEDGIGRTCDAISTAIAFTAVQAQIGESVTPPTDANPCLKGTVPPGTYDCPP